MSSDAITEGLWIGSLLQTKYARQDAEEWKDVAQRLSQTVDECSEKLIDVCATRDAYKSLSTEMVLELKGAKPRRLSLPNADKERLDHLEETRRMSLAKRRRDLTEQRQEEARQAKERASKMR